MGPCLEVKTGCAWLEQSWAYPDRPPPALNEYLMTYSAKAAAKPAAKPATELGTLLRQWRSTRGRSQFDLSLDAGVSQRHVSFIESGRSAPGRQTLLNLAQALDIPLRERNALLLAAGFPPDL